jgi:hypothetical protein
MTTPDPQPDTGPTPDCAETAAHAILGLVATHPGTFARLRVARLVAGFAVPMPDATLMASTGPYTTVVVDWPLRDMVGLVDALIDGGLIAQTTSPRPMLVLTIAGFRALAALDDAQGLQLVGADARCR